MNQNKQNSDLDAAGDQQRRAADFIRAVERVLRPIGRLLVRRGIGILHATELLKRAYLQAAADVAGEQGLPVTPKRLQLYTAIPRAEVDRLLQKVAASVDYSEGNNAAICRVLTTWHTDRDYVLQFVDTPRELPIEAAADELSFARLVKECAPQLNPKDLLEELVRAGAVQIDPERSNVVRAKARTYIPEPFSESDSERFGEMLSSYAETMDVNSRKPGPGLGRFDRRVMSDFPISDEDEVEFHQLVRVEGQKLLERLDGWLAQRVPASENGRRPAAAIFFYARTDVNADRLEEQPPSTGTREAGPKETFIDGNNDDDAIIDTLTFKFKKSRGKE